MTLKGGEPEAAEVLANERDGSSEVSGALDEMFDDLPGSPMSQQVRAFGPIAPVVAEDLLFVAVLRPIAIIRVGDGEPECSLIIAEAPRPGNEFARVAQ